MGDYIYDNVGWFLFATILFLFILFGFAVKNEDDIFARNMAECLADGRKHYECHALLKNHSQAQPMPIVMPVNLGR